MLVLLIDKLRTACACEAVIAFTIYGQVLFRKNKVMFPKDLREELGLNKKYFREITFKDSTRGTWKDYCVGLDGLKNISLVNNQIICQASFSLQNERLSTTASASISDQINQLIDNCNNTELENYIAKKAADLFIELLIDFSYMEYLDSTNYTWELLLNRCLRKDKVLLPITPTEYIRWFFDEEKQQSNLYYKHILRKLHTLKLHFHVHLYQQFKELFCTQIELKIIEKQCIMVIPCQPQSTFAIFPLNPRYVTDKWRYFTELNQNRVVYNLEILYIRWTPSNACNFSKAKFQQIVQECIGVLLNQNLEMDLVDFFKTVLVELKFRV